MTTFPYFLCELIGGAERYDQGDGFDVEIIKIKNNDHNSSLEKPLNRLTLANLCHNKRASHSKNVSATPPFNLVSALVGLLGARAHLQDCLHRNRRYIYVPTGRGRHQLLLDTTPTKMRRRNPSAETLCQLRPVGRRSAPCLPSASSHPGRSHAHVQMF